MSVIIDDIGTPKNVSALTITIVYKIIRINETRKLTAASSTVDRFINLFMIFIIILDISIPSKKIINAKSSVGKASLSVSVSFVRKSVAFSASFFIISSFLLKNKIMLIFISSRFMY